MSSALHPIGLDLIFDGRVSCGFQGAVAQLGERLICIQEVAGSIPTSSTSCWPSGREAGYFSLQRERGEMSASGPGL